MAERPQYPEYPGDGQDEPPAYGQAPTPPPNFEKGPPPPGYGQIPPPSYGQAPPPGYGQIPPPSYGQVPPPGYSYPPPGYGYPRPRTEGMAVASMVLGITSIFFCYLGVLIGPVAIGLSIAGRRSINAEPPGAVTGKGMATAGLVTGIIGTLIWAAVIAAVVISVQNE